MSKKMQQLESKLAELKSQQQKLIKQRNTEIAEGEDLQDYESLPKAAIMLGVLHASLERYEVNDSQSISFQKKGERLLRYG